MNEATIELAIEFANWLNNNWYEPTGYDSMWRLRIEDPEYTLPVPVVNIFNSEYLFEKFKLSGSTAY